MMYTLRKVTNCAKKTHCCSVSIRKNNQSAGKNCTSTIPTVYARKSLGHLSYGGDKNGWLINYNQNSATPTYTSDIMIHDDKSLSIARPHVWNAVPSSLRQDIRYRQFKQQLKTFLFRSVISTSRSDCRFLCLSNSLTNLFTYRRNSTDGQKTPGSHITWLPRVPPF